MGAVRHEFRRNTHILLRPQHCPDRVFIVESFLPAWQTALEKPEIPLRVEEALLREACLLEAVVDIGGQNKVVLILHQIIEFFINRFRRGLIAVHPDHPAHICPPFLG